ncbi:MAG: protein phosphatase 2C domain-containing protein [Euryarchaeota archaeon]|nr:protein phosphatase 2C domain-containing protein [Euryarchaeota archaeon]
MPPGVGEALRREAAPWTVLLRADRGRVRQRMEDAFIVELDVAWGARRVHAVGVFDGLGGEPHGQEAAQAAASTLRPALTAGTAAPRLLAELNAAVGKTGGATTAVLALLSAETPHRRVELFAVGDSAVYGTSVGSWRVLLPRDGARGNVVTDYLGNAGLRGHQASLDLGPGETLVLCTDGVDGVVDESQLRPLVTERVAGLDAAADQVMREVWARGAPDNATLAVVRRA